MSTPRPIHPTRQQLDELEALMQRMLELPVGVLPGEESEAPVEPAGRRSSADEPALDLAALSAGWEIAEALTVPAAIQPPPPSTAAPSAELPTPSAPVAEPADSPEAEGPSEMVPRSITVVESPAADGRSAARVSTSPARWLPAEQPTVDLSLPPPPWYLRPLVRCNRCFDAATRRLGPAGDWLRGSAGRTTLGWTGLILLTGSIAWAILDWLGWTW
jgi:hypothetical protein